VGERYSLRGGSGQHFDPCIDPAVFHAAGRKAVSDRGRTLFCYARPTQARNCFELLMDALRIVKERLGEGVRILTAGANWDPKAYGLERVLENLGLMSYQETAALYRRCDAGLVMMMTCHPSYLPMELMASGALVVSNRNPHTGWLLKDRENCLLAEAGPSAIADAVEEGLKDDQLRARVTRNALDLIRDQYSDWDAQAEKVHQYICSQS
jgi:glycosyltransferase involved in cell wall biosynthesis